MASSSTSAAPARVARIPQSLVRLAAPAGVAVAVAAVLHFVFSPWYLNYDARYALLWAGDLWHGDRPDYGTPFTPTPHPLQTAVGFLVHPFGASDQLLTWIVLLSFGALGWLVYRLGAELFSPWAGLVGGDRRAHTAGARARRAPRLPGHPVRGPDRGRGADRGTATAARRAGVRGAGDRGPPAARGMGPGGSLLPLDVAGGVEPHACALRRAGRPRLR